MIATLFAGYAAFPLVESDPVLWSQFGLHLFFLASAGFAGVISCSVLDRMRFSDFVQRQDLEAVADELRELDKAFVVFATDAHRDGGPARRPWPHFDDLEAHSGAVVPDDEIEDDPGQARA